MTKKNKSSKYRKIKAIEDKYGLMIFRCGLTHLFSCGAQTLSDTEEVTACKVKIENETPPNSIMTAGFQCGIIDCAVELADVGVWDLFRYIRTDVVINDWSDDEL